MFNSLARFGKKTVVSSVLYTTGKLASIFLILRAKCISLTYRLEVIDADNIIYCAGVFFMLNKINEMHIIKPLGNQAVNQAVIESPKILLTGGDRVVTY